MTMYAIMKETSYSGEKAIAYFSSRKKAIYYIKGIMNDCKPRGYDKSVPWYNSTWEYDVTKLFNVNNWNKYKYVNSDGTINFQIIAVQVM